MEMKKDATLKICSILLRLLFNLDPWIYLRQETYFNIVREKYWEIVINTMFSAKKLQ